jgi:hypothetical protein
MHVLIRSARCLSLAAHQLSNAWAAVRVTRFERQTSASEHGNHPHLVTTAPAVFDTDLEGAQELSGQRTVDPRRVERPALDGAKVSERPSLHIRLPRLTALQQALADPVTAVGRARPSAA